MATAINDARERGISIGRILNGAFGTIGSNPLATLGIAFLFGAVPGLLFNILSQGLRPATIAALGTGGVIVVTIVGAAVAIVFALLTQGALVRATVAHAEGRRASIGESIGAGLRVLGPLLVLGLLVGLCVGLGLLLLIVPGTILYMIWSVASPAMVNERLGIGASFERSGYLTKGARWKIFAVTLMVIALYYVVAGVGMAIVMAGYGGLFEYAAAMRSGVPVWIYAMNAVTQTLMAAIWGTVQASLYVELRAWKDGPASESLADIFA